MDNFRHHHYFLASCLAMLGLCLGFAQYLPTEVQAAVITWDGGGTDGTCGGAAGDGNKWSCGANWSTDIMPVAGDSVTFNGTSIKNATIDTAFSITTLNINAGYTGIITQAADLTVTNAGNFTHNTTDGTFTWASGTLSFTGSSGNWDVDTGDDTFGNVTINKTTANNVTVTASDTAIVSGTLTLADGNLNTGIIEARGDVLHGAGFDGGTGTLNITQGSTDVNLIAGGEMPTVNLSASRNLNGAGSGTVTFDGTLSVSNGAFVGAAGAVDLNGGLTLASPGSFTAPSGALNAAGSWTHTDSSTFTHNSGSVIFDGISGTLNVNTSEVFYDVTINASGTKTISSGDTLVVTNALVLTNGTINTGAIDARKDITQDATFDGGTAVIDFGDDAVVQTYTVNGGVAPTVQFNSAADASDSLTFTAAARVTELNVTAGFSGALPIVNAGDAALTFTHWSQPTGTYDASAQSSWTFSDFDRSGGTFIAPTLVTITGTGVNWNVATGGQIFNNLTINKNDGVTNYVNLTASNLRLIVTGDLTFLNGGIAASSATAGYEARGNVLVSSTFDVCGASLFFSGTATQTFDLTGVTGLCNRNITVDKTAGQVNLLSDLVMDAASQNLTLTEGTFNLNGYNLTANGTSVVVAVEDGGNLQIQGGETLTFNASYPTFSTDSTLTYTGNGNAGANTYTVTDLTDTFGNLTIASTDGATDTFQLGDAITVNGNFNLTSGTFDVSAGDFGMLIHGDWANTGTFNPRAGIVTLNGPDHELFGSTTFYDLTETTASASTLTFPAGLTQTVTHDLTLSGVSAGVRLSLRSSVPGSTAMIDPQGTRTLQYLDVKDNDNVNVLIANCAAGCFNSGNNVNWFFASTNTGGSVFPINVSIDLPACSGTQSVPITLVGTNVRDYLLSEDGNFIGTEWTLFNPQTANTQTGTFMLSPGDGGKTVHVMFRSISGNQTATYSAQVTLDQAGLCDGVIETEPDTIGTTPVGPINQAVAYYEDSMSVFHPVVDTATLLTYTSGCYDTTGFFIGDVTDRLVGDPLPLKAGATLLKFANDPKVYAITNNPTDENGRILRWIADENTAAINFGPRWSRYILELSSMPSTYTLGTTISTKEYSGTDAGLRSRASLTGATSYELSIVMPDGERRYGSSNFARISTDAQGISTYSFEDKTDFDYNDVVLAIDPSNCLTYEITALSHEAKLHSQVWLTVYWEGIPEADILVFPDSHEALSRVATVNVSNDILMNGQIQIQLKNSARESGSSILNFAQQLSRHLVSKK